METGQLFTLVSYLSFVSLLAELLQISYGLTFNESCGINEVGQKRVN